MKLTENIMQEIFAKLALHTGSKIKELQHPEQYKLGIMQTEILNKIKYCFIYFCKENEISEYKIIKILDYNIRTSLKPSIKTFEKNINYDPDYKFWYTQIKRFYYFINAKKYNQIEESEIYDFGKFTNIINQQNMFNLG